MSLNIKNMGNNYAVLKFENKVSLWTMLKTIVDAPYLKNFIIEDYDGGNTLVPIDVWKEEEIMYREIGDNLFLFPYDSIGFVFDDSIHNIKIYVIDSYSKGMDYRKKAICLFSIKDTDDLSLVLRDHKSIATVAALYLLSTMKVGFDNEILEQISNVLATIITDKMVEVEYMSGTLSFGIKGMTFVARFNNGETNSYFRIICHKGGKKKQIKEREARKLGYYKKKFINKSKFNKIMYYLIAVAIPILMVVALPILMKMRKSNLFMIDVGLLFLFFAIKIGKRFFKKNAYKFYKSK